ALTRWCRLAVSSWEPSSVSDYSTAASARTCSTSRSRIKFRREELGSSMIPTLDGKVVATTEARRARELATLIEKLGGVPYSVPAVREVPRADRAPALAVLDEILRGQIAAIVFLTGVGTRAFLALAADRGDRDRLAAAP